MASKKLRWLQKLGLRTMRDMALYLELRKAFGVKESLELMYIVEVE